MKISVFSYIDQVIAHKHALRFEIEEAQKAIDAFFQKTYGPKESFVNYTSRIKTDASLKEKIIRQNLSASISAPEELFSHISDLIGCRIECRFLRDEADVYESLFEVFPTRRSDGFYACDRDPRIELRLDEPQPQDQKNGYRSYRIDGHFLGKHVLNFELQIKSIVNVFWNEIDHKILYKNYNYVLTEKFVHDMMDSIMGDLTIIDRQMEMLFDHLRTLDTPDHFSPGEQMKRLIGRLIQDVYLTPLREGERILFDFRPSIDLICDFLFARVEYESREEYTTEFLRIMDDAFSGQTVVELFGEAIELEPAVNYHDPETERFGRCIERVMNADIIWNLLLQILIDLNQHISPPNLFRTFVDYLYFRVIHTIRSAFREAEVSPDENGRLVDEMTKTVLDYFGEQPRPGQFIQPGLQSLARNTVVTLRSEAPGDTEHIMERFRRFYPPGGLYAARRKNKWGHNDADDNSPGHGSDRQSGK